MRVHVRPDVYVEEVVPRGVIERAETSVAAFVGATPGGPTGQAVRMESLVGFDATYGSDDSPVRRLVADFFDNGGTAALVLRADSWAHAAGGLMQADPFQLLVVDPAVVGDDWSEVHDLCVSRRAFLVVQAGAGGEAPAGLGDNAAVYHPMLGSPPDPRPSTGGVAGVLARVDRTEGVWVAPAGSRAVVDGSTELVEELTAQHRDVLHAHDVNVLRVMPEGVVIWGARTRSENPEWKYVNVRRLLLFLESSLDEGLQWVVFEPNAEPTWAAVRAQVEDFLTALWRDGAFVGTKAEEAFFVRCDRGTMTQDDIGNGRFVVLVGIAMLRPAEFIILRIAKQPVS